MGKIDYSTRLDPSPIPLAVINFFLYVLAYKFLSQFLHIRTSIDRNLLQVNIALFHWKDSFSSFWLIEWEGSVMLVSLMMMIFCLKFKVLCWRKRDIKNKSTTNGEQKKKKGKKRDKLIGCSCQKFKGNLQKSHYLRS